MASNANTGLAALGGLFILLLGIFFGVVSIAFAFGGIHQGDLYGWSTVGAVALSALGGIAKKL